MSLLSMHSEVLKRIGVAPETADRIPVTAFYKIMLEALEKDKFSKSGILDIIIEGDNNAVS